MKKKNVKDIFIKFRSKIILPTHVQNAFSLHNIFNVQFPLERCVYRANCIFYEVHYDSNSDFYGKRVNLFVRCDWKMF